MGKFKVNQKVKHTRYGDVVIVSLWKADEHARFKGGVTLELLTKEGKDLFTQDRGGSLPRCFEDNMKKLILN